MKNVINYMLRFLIVNCLFIFLYNNIYAQDNQKYFDVEAIFVVKDKGINNFYEGIPSVNKNIELLLFKSIKSDSNLCQEYIVIRSFEDNNFVYNQKYILKIEKVSISSISNYIVLPDSVKIKRIEEECPNYFLKESDRFYYNLIEYKIKKNFLK